MGPVIIDLHSFELSAVEREMLQHPLVGGLILFSRNFADKAQLAALIKDIRGLVKRPFLISVDHEGGRVQRFREGFTAIPSMQQIEHFSDDIQQQLTLAQAMGFVMASELVSLDIDLSFAPVLDLNGISEVIGSRSFSADPDAVITLAAAYIKGMHYAGMKATGKHFPGHGSVQADSHVAMPQDERSYEEIAALDLRVFKQLIAQNALDAVMPAHVVYPQVDNQPAGFSSKWLQQELRGNLGFDGVIFSDDLSMQAATVAGSVVDRAEAALSAGCDMVLVCNSPKQAEQTLDGLVIKAYSDRAQGLLLQHGARAAFSAPKHIQVLNDAKTKINQCWDKG